MPKVTVITCVNYDDSLLPQFVDYYRSLGADAFVFGVFPAFQQKLTDFCNEYIHDCGFEIVVCPEDQEVAFQAGGDLEYLRANYVHEGWVIPADLDEFYEFPDTLQNLMALDYCSGTFVDRIARDGFLMDFNPDVSLWEQYPIECDISERLLQGWCMKVAFCRYDVPFKDGHHKVCDEDRQCLREDVRVHHFKWRGNIYDVLRERVALYTKLDFFFTGESERVIDYLDQHGRFLLEEFNAREGWKPGQPPLQTQTNEISLS